MSKPLVIYHADCIDGFGAAFAAWLKLGDEAEYLPMQYKQTYDEFWHNEDGTFDSEFTLLNREMYILDFSFPRWVMDGLFSLAKRVVWLDHHKSAFEMWCDGMPELEFHREIITDKRYIYLNNQRSGTWLAWEYFHPGTEVPMLIQHIDDRDRWQWRLEGSAEIHAALASYKPWSFKQWMQFVPYFDDTRPYIDLKKEGVAILRAQNTAVVQAVKHARGCCIRLYDPAHDSWQRAEYGPEEFSGLAVSCPLHQSEIGHELANKSGTFGLIWYMDKDGSIICSLRSNGDYDVSAIAKTFGGGGHKNAAGFQTDVETLRGWLK